MRDCREEPEDKTVRATSPDRRPSDAPAAAGHDATDPPSRGPVLGHREHKLPRISTSTWPLGHLSPTSTAKQACGIQEGASSRNGSSMISRSSHARTLATSTATVRRARRCLGHCGTAGKATRHGANGASRGPWRRGLGRSQQPGLEKHGGGGAPFAFSSPRWIHVDGER